MKRSKPIILFTILLLYATGVWAREKDVSKVTSHTDSVTITFRQSKWDLDLDIGNNSEALDSIDSRLTTVLQDSVYRLRHVSVLGGASPEGTVAFNKFLSEHRAATLFGWFDKYNQLTDLDKSFTFYGRDWEGVLRLADKDPQLPYREETLSLLETIVSEKRSLNGEEPNRSLQRIKQLRGGEPYRYLYRHIFPKVRASKVVIDYERVLTPAARPPQLVAEQLTIVPDTLSAVSIKEIEDTAHTDISHKGPFYMDLRSNILYDALALPNIGIEFYLGKNFSVGANWLYGWWKTDPRHRYWRAYGGEVFGRWWFGSKAEEKPLTGHHVGVYCQLYTYDFEWGGTGEMGGKPGGNLWDRNLWGAGAEYGYSLPVGRHINLDFSIGIGYTTGEYHKYKPIDGHYVWQSTHKRKYFGPTKLEVAFVWLLGKMKRACILLAGLLSVILSSCNHKELCYVVHPHPVTVRVEFDWEEAPEANPAGMCVFFYHEDDGITPVRVDFQGTRGGEVELTPGIYRIVTYNNDTEVVHAYNTYDFDHHYVTTREGHILEPIYGNGLPMPPRSGGTEDERVMITPDMLWGCNKPGTVVSQDSAQVITLRPHDMLCHYSYEVRNVKHLKHVSQMSAALSGMSPTLMISDESLQPEAVTLPFEAHKDGESMIRGEFLTFGHHDEIDNPHRMAFYMVMDDGSKYSFTSGSNLDVTQQVHSAPDRRRVHLVIDGLDLPTPIENGDGFNPNVDDWDDVQQEIEL